MNTKQLLDSAVEHLQKTAGVKTVYGEPLAVNGKTIIPVARVAYGFGGGSSPKKATGTADDTTSTTDQTPGGVGGGMAAKPVGVVEITPEETKFVPFGQKKRMALIGLLGSAVGLGLGFMFGRTRH
jgi:uncharacterized spore protein YtfJ